MCFHGRNSSSRVSVAFDALCEVLSIAIESKKSHVFFLFFFSLFFVFFLFLMQSFSVHGGLARAGKVGAFFVSVGNWGFF